MQREARRVQWDNVKKEKDLQEQRKKEKEESKEHKKQLKQNIIEESLPSCRTMIRTQASLRYLLLDEYNSQLELLALIVPEFLDCKITSSCTQFSTRERKSTMYRKLKVIRDFLVPLRFRDQCILKWAQNIALIDYNNFKARGLCFVHEKDIPRKLLVREGAEKIWSEMVGKKRKEYTRQLTVLHAIKVYEEVILAKGLVSLEKYTIDRHQLVTELATAIRSSRKFARHVITSVDAGKKAELLSRKRRQSSIGEDILEELH